MPEAGIAPALLQAGFSADLAELFRSTAAGPPGLNGWVRPCFDSAMRRRVLHTGFVAGFLIASGIYTCGAQTRLRPYASLPMSGHTYVFRIQAFMTGTLDPPNRCVLRDDLAAVLSPRRAAHVGKLGYVPPSSLSAGWWTDDFLLARKVRLSRGHMCAMCTIGVPAFLIIVTSHANARASSPSPLSAI